MSIFFEVLTLIFLFILLGLSAELAVKNIKYLGAILKIRLFVFGVILGLITSLPELLVGINALEEGTPAITVGNLFGGVVVKLGLILGISLLFGRKIITDGRLTSIVPIVLAIFTPVILGMDGQYSSLDGLIMLFIYLGLIYYLHRLNHFENYNHLETVDIGQASRSLVLIIIGIVGIVAVSDWIMKVTVDLLLETKISQMVVGLMVFSIGTNLPEASIAIVSFFKKTSELSLSNLLSSSFTNAFILGSLASIRPFIFEIDYAFWLMTFFLAAILIFTAFFYYSGKKMDRREGAVLFAGYLLFIVVNIYLSL